MNEIYSTLVFSDDNGVYLRLVTDITIYWRGSIFEHSDGILNFYRQVLNKFGQNFKFYRTESMIRPKAVNASILELLPHWLSSAKSRKGIYMLSLESGENGYEPSDMGFYLLADEEEATKTGLIRLILPASFMDDGVNEVLPFLGKLLVGFNYESGHAGFAVNWDPEGESEDEAARTMTMLARKYPGIDLNYVDSTIIAFQNSNMPSIKCANWLTLVGTDISSVLPPMDQLRDKMSDNCKIHEIPGGLVFQAGPIPKLGYPDRTEMEPYKKIGNLLADFRLYDHPQIFAEPTTGDFSTEEWLARFDH